MKVQVIYASRTGCTEKLAQAIFNKIEADEKTLHNLNAGIPVLDGDIILFGYWGFAGGPDAQTKEFLSTVKGKVVGVFCTLGFYAESVHAFDTLQTGVNLLKENNTVIGSYVCNGAIASGLKKNQGKEDGAVPTEQKEIRWALMASHPTTAECSLGAERFSERIKLYTKCKEHNIPFEAVL